MREKIFYMSIQGCAPFYLCFFISDANVQDVNQIIKNILKVKK